MKKIGYIVMLIGCLMLFGFVGHDEANPGGDFGTLLARIAVAAVVVMIGLFLAGVKDHVDHSVR